MCNFDPKIWTFVAKSQVIVLESRFCQQGIQRFFFAILGNSPIAIISTLNFGPQSTKLGGTVRAINKMTQNDNGPGPCRNYGETAVFMFGRKVVFGQKTVFFCWKTDIYLGEGYFFLVKFFPVVARIW